MTPEEVERYARHIVLPEIGGAGQQRLMRARMLVVGAGGLGSAALLYLAAAGVGTIGIADDDCVSLSNLQRQVIHGTDDVGAPKVGSAARAIARLNPGVRVEPHPVRLDAAGAAAMVPRYDLVLDGSDSFETRMLVNAACVAAARPLVSGSMARWEGQLAVYDPATGGPCYACVFPEAPAPGLVAPCAEAGVIGALPGIVGAMMALEAIKIVTGAGAVLRGSLLLYDALYPEMRRITVRRRADCVVCGTPVA